jgi:hypothetical protein
LPCKFLLLLLLSTPAFAITIKTLDLNDVDDTTIEITAMIASYDKLSERLLGGTS